MSSRILQPIISSKGKVTSRQNRYSFAIRQRAAALEEFEQVRILLPTLELRK